MPLERDKLIILVIVGSRMVVHCLRREVGIGSKSQVVSEDWDINLETSSHVANLKVVRTGGEQSGDM